jgi:transcriptional regulator with XRE-family HTH domain
MPRLKPQRPTDASPIRRRIAARLRAAREAGGWTVEECAKDAAVSVQSWYKWEQMHRAPDLDLLDAVAAAVGLTTAELVG